ncbi:DUF3137 domain-containing protein [Novosphingobium sp.]|uniref:DUF3137 domain-containing protein n=1 Tax=Novosphingobium sp. TaxID=1874826 RepID=UPI003C7B93BF
MIVRPDPGALMAGQLGTWLESQNAERAAVTAKVRRIWMLAIAAGCAVAVAVTLFGDNIGAGMQFGFFTGLAGFGIAEWVKRPMINRLKGGINSAIAQALELDYVVEVVPGDAFQQAYKFQLLPSHDTARFADGWRGNLGGRPFAMHEAKLTEERGGGKSRRTVTVFEGQVLSIGFNRQFNSTTLLEPNAQRRKFFVGAEKEQVTIGGVELERVDMTNPQFEERFTLWSNDQVEARYLVHPEYLERLLAVEQAFAGEDIRALFQNGDLVVTIKTGDLFESGSLDSSDDRTLLETAIAQFGSLADLAVQLNEKPRMTFADLAGSNSAGP